MAEEEDVAVPPAEGELHAGDATENFPVDPVSYNMATSKEIKDRQEFEKEKKKKKDATQTIKSVIMVSGVIVAVAGVIFAVHKKMRETRV